MAKMEGGGWSLGKMMCSLVFGHNWELLAHGSEKTDELPTLCSPAAHGRYSRAQQTAVGRLGREQASVVSFWLAKPACICPSLMGQALLINSDKIPDIVTRWAARAIDLAWHSLSIVSLSANQEAERTDLSHVTEQLAVNSETLTKIF